MKNKLVSIEKYCSYMMSILPLFFLASCASTLKITSSVPARIEMEGRYLCDTPCNVDTTYWNNPNQFLEAFPIDNNSNAVKQSKRIRMDIVGDTAIFFDMQASMGVKTIYRDTADDYVTVEKKNESQEEKKEKDLLFLKKMKDKGTIDEKTYNDLVKKSLE